MILSLNTLKNFTTLPAITTHQLATRLTTATCEVEKIIPYFSHLDKVVSVKITKIEDHPNAQKLHLVSFTNGTTQQQVVCGAPNVAVGLITTFAPLGTTLPNGITLQAKEIKGIISHGMLCSQNELGLGDDESGIIEWPQDTPLGQTLAQLVNQESDTLLEIDNKSLTNRSDLWGFYGMAFEFSALFNTPFNQLALNEALLQPEGELLPLTLNINDDSSCIAFNALVMKGVDNRPSPLFMQHTLTKLGMRPVNALVDISNYVMLELGLPTHFYNYQKIEGATLQVSALKKPLTFLTLDGKERELAPGDTVISDTQEPLVIAGIMGGDKSKIDDHTNTLVIEVAVWQAEEVRKTGLRIGLRTDASVRYEKSLDPYLLQQTLKRCVQLVKQVFPESQVASQVVHYHNSKKSIFQPYTTQVNLNRFSQVMGLQVTTQQAIDHLNRLGFNAQATNDNFIVNVNPPSFRNTKELMAEADIFEELGRLIGYHNIEAKEPLWPLSPNLIPNRVKFERKTQDFFVLQSQMLEVFTHPMTGEQELKKAEWPTLNESLRVANSVSPEADRLRPSLIPSFLTMCELNQKHYNRFSCFEYGRAFEGEPNTTTTDRYKLAFVLFDRKESRFLEALNYLEKYVYAMALPKLETPSLSKKNPLASWSGLHPKECRVIMLGGETKGLITTVHPLLLKKYKINGYATLVELDLTLYIDNQPKDRVNYQPLSRYPSSLFDCTVLVNNKTQAGELITVLTKANLNFVTSVKLAEVFKLNESQRAVTVRSTLQHNNGTLTSQEIKTTEDLIVATLKQAGYPLKI